MTEKEIRGAEIDDCIPDEIRAMLKNAVVEERTLPHGPIASYTIKAGDITPSQELIGMFDEAIRKYIESGEFQTEKIWDTEIKRDSEKCTTAIIGDVRIPTYAIRDRDIDSATIFQVTSSSEENPVTETKESY